MTKSLPVRLSSKALKNAPTMRQTALIIPIAIICVVISPAFTAAAAADYPPTGSQPLRIIDHAMAGSVEELSVEAIDRREAFLTSDIKACSWASFGDILSEHMAEWRWYSPDGSLYRTDSREVPLPSSDFWSWYNVYSCMDIAGADASQMPGSWHVDIYLDDLKILTEHFTIAPSKDLSYSGTTQGGCYTDTKTGQVICIDRTSDSSASGGSASEESVFGESDQTEVQGGCYADPKTGAVVCVDIFGNPYGGQDGSFGPEEMEGYSQPPADVGPTGESETTEQSGSSQGDAAGGASQGLVSGSESEEAQVEGAQTGEIQTDETQSEEVQPEEVQPGEGRQEEAPPNDNISVKESYAVLSSAAQAIDSGNTEAFLQCLSNETRSGVRGILDFSTPEAGKMAVGLRSAKPKEIMADLVVYEMTIDKTAYSFNTIKEEGAWKISGL